jgi:hypothetical protein
MDKKIILFSLMILVILPIVSPMEITEGVIVNPNESSGGQYTINNTITLNTLEFNGTDVTFGGLASGYQNVSIHLDDGTFLSNPCPTGSVCDIVQTTFSNRVLVFLQELIIPAQDLPLFCFEFGYDNPTIPNIDRRRCE